MSAALPEFTDLIGDIYEASYRPEHWPKVIEKITHITRSCSGALFIQDKALKEASGLYAHGWTEAVVKDYAEHGHNDPGFLIMRDQPVGVAVNMLDTSRHELETPEYFEVIRQRHDIGYASGANLLVEEDRHVGLGLHRSASEVAYENEILELLNGLIPHLQRALKIHREFIRLRVEKLAITTGLDHLMIGLVLFDHLGVPVYANPVAETILADHPAISKRHNSILPVNSDDAARLRQLIFACITESVRSSKDSAPGGAIGLNHPDKPHPLAVLVKPVSASDLTNMIDGEPVYAAMYLSDPDSPLPLSGDTLSALYQLTPSEARIAIALTNGLSVEDICESLGRSTNTVRTHLRSIFEKTRTSGQADLVRLLLSSAAF